MSQLLKGQVFVV